MPRFLHLLFVSVLVVLLPLRGWAGDVMAVDMVAATVSKLKVLNMGSQAAMPADCAMHSEPASADTEAHCNSCDTCELCLAVANLQAVAWSASQLIQHASTLMPDARFNSTALATNRKPPIS